MKDGMKSTDEKIAEVAKQLSLKSIDEKVKEAARKIVTKNLGDFISCTDIGHAEEIAVAAAQIAVIECGMIIARNMMAYPLTPDASPTAPDVPATTPDADYKGWEEDLEWDMDEWRLEVRNLDTRRGYLEWVEAKKEESALDNEPVPCDNDVS